MPDQGKCAMRTDCHVCPYRVSFGPRSPDTEVYPLDCGQKLWCEHFHASRTHPPRMLKSARSNRQCADHRNRRVGNSWLWSARPATDTYRLLRRGYLFGTLVGDDKTTCAGSGLELCRPNSPQNSCAYGSRSSQALQLSPCATRCNLRCACSGRSRGACAESARDLLWPGGYRTSPSHMKHPHTVYTVACVQRSIVSCEAALSPLGQRVLVPAVQCATAGSHLSVCHAKIDQSLEV